MTYEQSMQNVVDWAVRTVTKDDIWVDVGANAGYITFCLCRTVRPREVIMIEPLPQGLLADRMIRTVVSDKAGSVRFNVSRDYPERSSLIDRQGGTETIEMQSTTLDLLLHGKEGPLVIKLDTEFTEPLVWKGMQKILPKVRAMCVEYFPDILKNDADLDSKKFMEDLMEHFTVEESGHDLFLTKK